VRTRSQEALERARRPRIRSRVGHHGRRRDRERAARDRRHRVCPPSRSWVRRERSCSRRSTRRSGRSATSRRPRCMLIVVFGTMYSTIGAVTGAPGGYPARRTSDARRRIRHSASRRPAGDRAARTRAGDAVQRTGRSRRRPSVCQVLFLGDDGHHRPVRAGRRSCPSSPERRRPVLHDDPADLNPDTRAVRRHHLLQQPADGEPGHSSMHCWGSSRTAAASSCVHCASASFQNSEEFVRLVGGAFKSHGTGTFSAERVAPDHPAIRTCRSSRAGTRRTSIPSTIPSTARCSRCGAKAATRSRGRGSAHTARGASSTRPGDTTNGRGATRVPAAARPRHEAGRPATGRSRCGAGRCPRQFRGSRCRSRPTSVRPRRGTRSSDPIYTARCRCRPARRSSSSTLRPGFRVEPFASSR
jgi:hypothetical protein